MRWFLVIPVAAMACKNVPAPTDPFDPDAEAELPSWIDQQLSADAEACASSPYWEDANMATSFFAGSFVIQGDVVTGNEFWILYPNDNLASTGFTDCMVVWDFNGTVGEPEGVGTYSLHISAVVDVEQTTCVEDANGNPVYVGDEDFPVQYDVLESGDEVTVRFSGSGDILGRGQIEGGVVSWISDNTCPAF